MKYVVVIEKSDNGYSAYVPDLPGCVAAADTRDETDKRIRGAIPEPSPSTLVVDARI